MPGMARLVVCGFALVIAIFSPTRALVRVDLPTFGRPTNVANPLRMVSLILCPLRDGRPLDEHRRDPSTSSARRTTGEDQAVHLSRRARLRHLPEHLAQQTADRVD